MTDGRTSLKSIRIKNFKAIKDSGSIKLTPLTVFIGNNGSGKSSLIEALRTMQDIVDEGLDQAMQSWSGFEHIWHQGSDHKVVQTNATIDRPSQSNPMSIEIKGKGGSGFRNFSARTEISLGASGDELFFTNEEVKVPDWSYSRDRNGDIDVSYSGKQHIPQSDLHKFMPVYFRQWSGSAAISISERLEDDKSLLEESLEWFISDWQYIQLDPQVMGSPVPQQRTGGYITLARDGSNVAQYLDSIRRLDQFAFEGIIETLRYVLPYARDLQPGIAAQLDRSVYLQLTEADFKIYGWLLSSGTLRLVALLALLRHPTPPPLIMIEEIENGIDPRALHLLVEEIRRVTESELSQILLTTHSPYLLDLLDLSHIVTVERDGETNFARPGDQKDLAAWRDKFTVGQLYTMGKLSTPSK